MKDLTNKIGILSAVGVTVTVMKLIFVQNSLIHDIRIRKFIKESY